jgi:carbon-monoxide dehydrogenase medium subunit
MRAPLAKDIFEPETVEEAVKILQDKGEDAAIIAGGTDLVISLREGVIQPSNLVDIFKLPLNYIKGTGKKGIRIGATTTVKDISKSTLLKNEIPVLVDAGVHLGGPQTIELATVGGNICNASPCANFTNVLIAFDTFVRMKGPEGEREMMLKDFFRGPGVTELKTSEILTEIEIPAISGVYGASYVKHTLRKEMDIAIVGAAAFIMPEVDKIAKIRIALGSVGATVLLAENAQKILEGKAFSVHLAESAAKAAAEKDASYIDDVRASAAYRKKITQVAVKKAVSEAWASARGGKL